MHLAGVCSTDLEMVSGCYPFEGIPGHEFVGLVADENGRPGLRGNRVVGDINRNQLEKNPLSENKSML